MSRDVDLTVKLNTPETDTLSLYLHIALVKLLVISWNAIAKAWIWTVVWKYCNCYGEELYLLRSILSLSLYHYKHISGINLITRATSVHTLSDSTLSLAPPHLYTYTLKLHPLTQATPVQNSQIVFPPSLKPHPVHILSLNKPPHRSHLCTHTLSPAAATSLSSPLLTLFQGDTSHLSSPSPHKKPHCSRPKACHLRQSSTDISITSHPSHWLGVVRKGRSRLAQVGSGEGRLADNLSGTAGGVS